MRRVARHLGGGWGDDAGVMSQHLMERARMRPLLHAIRFGRDGVPFLYSGISRQSRAHHEDFAENCPLRQLPFPGRRIAEPEATRSREEPWARRTVSGVVQS